MISVILCAAGKGSRAGFKENKILREYCGLPVLSWSLSAFSAAGADEILVACAPKDEERIKALLVPYPAAATVQGGMTRFKSVFAALQKAKGDIVLVHDAARPFVTEEAIHNCIQCVKTYGSGVCALPATDTVVLVGDNLFIRSVPPRETAFTVQTPQGFYRDKLLFAYKKANTAGIAFTDESGVYARYVGPPRLFLGDPSNRKLTFAEDVSPAERVGYGADTHAFGGAGDHITLGGVKVPSERVLLAHSDGDVLCHALTDALLSAAGLDDIGHYFPDTDESLRGAYSLNFVEKATELVRGAGFTVKNASIAVIAEQPRLFSYIGEMRRKLASALKITENAVGIAAGTNERLGYVGEGKGITAYAAVLLAPAGRA